MLSQKLAILLKKARQQLEMSREDLAKRAGVSYRLVAELERGQRQHVSFETALKLLNEVGVSITARAPDGEVARVESAKSVQFERLARAAQRRKTWNGAYSPLHQADLEPQVPRSASQRAGAVSHVSKQAYVIAGIRSANGPVPRKSKRTTVKHARQRQTDVKRSNESRAK